MGEPRSGEDAESVGCRITQRNVVRVRSKPRDAYAELGISVIMPSSGLCRVDGRCRRRFRLFVPFSDS